MKPDGVARQARGPLFGATVRVVIGMAVVFFIVLRIQACQVRPGFEAVTDDAYRDGGRPDTAVVALGRLLFFDEVLSGNRNISCATCHHPRHATTDGLSLSIGEGGTGPERTGGSRLPRNAPALFNLGARGFDHLFHDGRVAVDPAAPSGFATPLGDALPEGLHSVLAAQALIPLAQPAEMAGQAGENDVADAASRGQVAGDGGVWNLLARRLRDIPAYVDLSAAAYADVDTPADLTIVHVANALAAFVASAFRSDDSPFDRYLRGDARALTPAQVRGMAVFYGGGGRCSRCHAGPFQTDHQFHAIGMPQIGPGAGGGADGHDDYGRAHVTGRPQDRYRFRTPSLRNVALTGPWGHDGAYGTLEAMVVHYRIQNLGLIGYDRQQVVLPPGPEASDFTVMDDPARVAAIVGASEAQSLPLTQMTAAEIADLLAFLEALTDPRARDLSDLIPRAVPSGHLTVP